MKSQLSISIGQHSDKGIKDENQDFHGATIPDEQLLESKGIAIAIADGVSSSDLGKKASIACVNGFMSDYFSTPESWTVKTSVQKVLTALNGWLYSNGHAAEHASRGMVTTLSALILKSTKAHIFHVGDSRIYRFTDNTLEQLTNDHRLWVSEEKNYLSRAMGIDVLLDIDYQNFEIDAGDIFVLTTDGVHDYIDEKTISNLLAANVNNLDDAAKTIVEQAISNKSLDNLTCQIIRIDSLPSQNKNDVYKELTELPFPPPLSQGMILDGYQIESEIHSSKRTQVYKAKDTKTNEFVVIKTPSVNFEDEPSYIESFLREEWIGKRIKNKNVLRVKMQNRKRQCLYYVTEYINGQTLRQWIKEHPQPEITEVREIVKQIAAGLRAFHRLEMLHQDLKPENIMLDATGMVKVVDFGSTKIAGIAEITTPIERINLLGTKNYTAPEYLLGQPGTNRSDIFSLGVITYELLTGKLPYGDAFEKDLKPAQLSTLVYHPSYHYNPMVPAWLDKAIGKAVRPNPKSRYDLLSEFITDISKPNSHFMQEKPMPLLERNPLKFWQLLSLLLVLLNLFLIYLLQNS
jgi:serine/threonine protein kinase